MKKLVGSAIAFVVFFGTPLAVRAQTHHHAHHCPRHFIRRHHRCVRQHHRRPPPKRPVHVTPPIHAQSVVRPTITSTAPSATPAFVSATPALVEIGNVPGCQQGGDPTPWLRVYGATALRIIINPWHKADEWWACIQQARASGYRIHLVLQWWNTMSVTEAQDFYRQELPKVGSVWAISIGNEQELGQPTPDVHGQNGATYAAYWRALEPIVQFLAPQALRVAGEASPWGVGFLRDALANGLPGVQAISAHPYNGFYSAAAPTEFLNLARFVHLPLWDDEALDGPNAWPAPGFTRTVAELAGATTVGAWIK